MMFKLKGRSIRAAAKLGIAFELCYAPAILEPSCFDFELRTSNQHQSVRLSVTAVGLIFLSAHIAAQDKPEQ